jgi:hypothetical protein
MSDEPKRGRPIVGDEPESVKLQIRLTPTERADWETAAKRSKHKTLSAWLRSVANRAAGKR